MEITHVSAEDLNEGWGLDAALLPRSARPRCRRGSFGGAIYELVRGLEPEEQDALLSRGGHGFLVRLGSDGMPEAALMFDPDDPEARRLLRYTPLRGERLA